MKKGKTDQKKLFFVKEVMKFWNVLPQDVVQAVSVSSKKD